MESKYYQEANSVIEYIKLAKDADCSELLKVLTNYLAPNSTLLEIGSGPGNDFQKLKMHYQVTGSDYSAIFLKHLSQRFPEDNFYQLNAIDLNTTLKFDGIYSNKVLQHLTIPELKQSLKSQKDLLNDSGLICHTFWRGDGIENFKNMMVQNYQISDLRDIFEKDYNILEIDLYREFMNEDSIMVIAQKK